MLRVDRLRIGDLPPLSFDVPAGECLAVAGPSGSGKTRLLRAIADLDPAEGYVTLDAVGWHEMPAPAWRRLVRYAAAEPGWWADTPRPHFTGAAAAPDRLARSLAGLGLEPRHLDRPLAELSTGERQRLSLLRAIADEPKVLLLDEPTSALDGASAALAEELIRFQLLSRRIVILVSHEPGLVARLAHQRLELARSQHAAAAAETGAGARAAGSHPAEAR